MKRRLTYTAVLLVFADLLALGAVWQFMPTLSLVAALAVPDVEAILAPLYPDAAPQEAAVHIAGVSRRVELYRPPRALTGVVLLHDAASRGHEIDALARVLARRNVAVVIPRGDAIGAAAVWHDYGRQLGLTLRVWHLDSLRVDGSRASIGGRAQTLWRLFHTAGEILAP